MARIIDTDVSSHISLNIQTVFEDGTTSDKVVRVDDMMSGVRYVEDEDIKVIENARLAAINYKYTAVTRSYKNASTMKSYFKEDVVPTTIVLDKSLEYHSDLVEVPVIELLEDAGVVDVARMKTFLSYGVDFTIETSDDKTAQFTIHEGDNLVDLEYLDRGGVETVDAKVVAFKFDKNLVPTHLECIINGRAKELEVLQIKAIGEAVVDSTPEQTMEEIVAASETGRIYLTEGEFTGAITTEKEVNIVGAMANVVATPETRNVETLEGETVITGKIAAEAGASVKLTGVALTADALVNLNDAKEIELTNCILTNLVADASTTNAESALEFKPGPTTKVVIKGCYFGDCNSENGKKLYNLINIHSTIADGSEISDNYFADSTSSHNIINIYNAVPNSVINIENNVFEKSANAIRIGVSDDDICTININNNTYNATDADEAWAGLVIIQPRSNSTTMANLTVNINNTTNNSGIDQLWYKYTPSTNMQFDETNVPTVIVDGVVESAPVIA